MSLSENKSTKFLLADDHSLIRQGIVFLLEDMDFDFEVHHASNFSQILETISMHPIDIAIIDAHFPDGNSLTILPEIKKIRPEIKILIFSGIDENTHSLKFMNAGANGFLSKLSEEGEVMQAILKIRDEGEYISPVTKALLINSMQNRRLINPLLSLTERELEVAEMYVEGCGNLEISNKLNLKQNTVSTIKKRMFAKLNIDNIVELIELFKNHY